MPSRIDRISEIAQWVKKNEPSLVAASQERERFEASERGRKYRKALMDSDPAWKRMVGFRHRFTSCLVRKWAGGRPPERSMQTSQKLFGCSWEKFRAEIEKQFQPGMTWENHGKGDGRWSLDHRRPVFLFDWWTWEGLREAFHWSNVQPLWNWQHRAKSDFERTQVRKRHRSSEESRKRIKDPLYAPDLEGSDQEILARLERDLGIAKL